MIEAEQGVDEVLAALERHPSRRIAVDDIGVMPAAAAVGRAVEVQRDRVAHAELGVGVVSVVGHGGEHLVRVRVGVRVRVRVRLRARVRGWGWSWGEGWAEGRGRA